MKRGKDDTGPMFPRLHVNDQEKGGPRAPPRNKMALYEQLSVPSQRFNRPGGGTIPLNHDPASSSQGNVQHQVAPKPPPSRYLNLSPSLTQVEHRKESDEENDFTVPIFDNDHHLEKLSPSSQAYSIYSTLQSASNKEPKHNGITRPKARQQLMDQSEGPLRENTSNDFIRLQKARSRLHPVPEQVADLHPGPIKSPMFSSQRNFPALRNRDDRESCEVHASIGRRGYENSETSMEESVSEMDISPDDVVGLIGHKHFWKARKAFVNQQRVFAVQLFELHRLIKVQKLIAESPHLLLENNAYLENPSPIKPSSTKKLPLEYIITKPPLNISKQKNEESEKRNDKIEYSAENTVGKAFISSVQNDKQLGGNGNGNPQTSGPGPGPNMSPWGFNPQGHQWLVPVMTATEGLVYKPYSGPAFTNHGVPPPGSTPGMANFMSGPTTFYPPAGPHGYFPQYGTNPEQTSRYITQDSIGELSGGGANFSVQCQNSCDQPNQPIRVQKTIIITPKDRELHASTASSLRVRGSRLSNNNYMERINELPLFPTKPVKTTSRVERPLPIIRNPSPNRVENEQPSRVIKVVPHNGRSASEFAARIFRSIQQERNHNDSV